MDISLGTPNFNAWTNKLIDLNSSLLKEINRIRSLYAKALEKEGNKLSASEHFAVIAVHMPEITMRRGNEWVAARCFVDWVDGDYVVEPLTMITRKKRKVKPVVTKKKKKRKLEVTKKKKKKKRKIVLDN